MTAENDPADAFDKVAAREAQLEDSQARRTLNWTGYPGKPPNIGARVSFFVTVLLLLPLHWIVLHDSRWLVISHVVIIAIAGGKAFGALAGSKTKDQRSTKGSS